MNPIQSNTWNDEQQLGSLAMQFRGTKRDVERRTIAKAYSEVVERLIQSGAWEEAPSPEDQLPDDWMPGEFFAYWGLTDEESLSD